MEPERRDGSTQRKINAKTMVNSAAVTDGRQSHNYNEALFSKITPDELWPLTEEDLQTLVALEREKVSSLAAYAARFVFEQHYEICKEELRYFASLPAAPYQSTVALDKLPFPRQVGNRSFFCGREGDLNSLSRYFNKDLKEGRPRIKVISGYGGLGKTQVSFQYAYNNRQNYPGGVFYFHLESIRTFHDSVKNNIVIVGLASIGIVSQDFEKLQERLRRWPKCLFIYDGADMLVLLNDYIPSIAVDVIITTRMANFDHPQLRGNSILTLKVLDGTTSVQILFSNSIELVDGQVKAVDDFQKESPEDYEYAEKIAGKQCLDGLPLALLHASSFKKSQGPSFSFKHLWEKLQKDMSILSLNPANVKEWLKNYNLKHIDSKLEQLHLESLDDLRHLSQQRLDSSDLTVEEKKELLKAKDELVRAPAYITWRLDIEASCEKSPHNLGRDVLCLSAMLPSNDIPEGILIRGVALRNKGCNEADVRIAIYHICSHSLLTYQYTPSASNCSQPVQVRTFAMHPMIQYSVTKYLMTGKIREEVLICLGAVLCRSLPSAADFQKELRLTEDSVKCLTAHLYHVASAMAESSEPLKNRWQRRTVALACIFAIRLFDVEVRMVLCKRRLEEARRRPDKEELADALIQVGRCHSILIEREAVNVFFKEAIDLLGDMPPSKRFQSVERWGEALFEIVRGYRLVYAMDKVESIAEKMKRGLMWAEATECQSYAQCLNAIAVCRRHCASNTEEVFGLSQLALRLYRNSLPEPHPNIATELGNLAFCYLEQGMYPEAEKYALQSVEMRKKCLPAKHHNVAYSLWLLGAIYTDWGRYKDAGCYLLKAAKVVDSIHVNYATLFTLQALAEWQALVNKKCEAEKNQQKALEMMERVIGHHNRNSKANAIYQSGCCWMALGKYKEAEECLKKAKDVLGNVPEDNYVLLKVTLLQGQCLVAQGRFNDAQSLLGKVQEVLDSLKPRHSPQRGATLHYLGVCLINQGWNETAEPLLREALKLRKEVLVENDMRTVDTCRELRRCLGLLGKQEEARKLSELCLFMKRHSNEIDYDSMTTSSHAPAESGLQSAVQGNSGWQSIMSVLFVPATIFLLVFVISMFSSCMIALFTN